MKKPQKTKRIQFDEDVEDILRHFGMNCDESLGSAILAFKGKQKELLKEGYAIHEDDVNVWEDGGATCFSYSKLLKNSKYEEQMKAWEIYQNDEDQKLIDQLVAKGYTVEKK